MKIFISFIYLSFFFCNIYIFVKFILLNSLQVARPRTSSPRPVSSRTTAWGCPLSLCPLPGGCMMIFILYGSAAERSLRSLRMLGALTRLPLHVLPASVRHSYLYMPTHLYFRCLSPNHKHISIYLLFTYIPSFSTSFSLNLLFPPRFKVARPTLSRAWTSPCSA